MHKICQGKAEWIVLYKVLLNGGENCGRDTVRIFRIQCRTGFGVLYLTLCANRKRGEVSFCTIAFDLKHGSGLSHQKPFQAVEKMFQCWHRLDASNGNLQFFGDGLQQGQGLVASHM